MRSRSVGTAVRALAKGQVYPKAAMDIPLCAGRDIAERDTSSSEPIILINETMARRLLPGGSALGKIVRACGERQVIGLVGDVPSVHFGGMPTVRRVTTRVRIATSTQTGSAGAG